MLQHIEDFFISIDLEAKKLYDVYMVQWRSATYTLLRSSEKYFKTDMVYLAKGGFWLVVGQLIVSGVSFGLSVAFANLLEPDVYGTYRYILTIFNFLAIPTLTGINVALMRAAAQGMENSLLLSFKTRLLWGFLGTLAGLAVALYYLAQGAVSLALNLFIISLFVPLFYSFEVYSYFLRGKKLFKQYALYHALSLAIPALILIGMLFFGGNLTVLLVSYFLPYTILKGLFLYLTVQKHMRDSVYDPEVISYGKHLSAMGIFSIVAQNIDKFLLWHFLGGAQLAVYTIALAPISNIEAIIGKLDTLIFPKIAERGIGELRKNVYRKGARLFFYIAVIVGVYILLAPFLYSLLFPQYLESIRYSQALSFTLLLSLPIMFVSTIFTAHAKIREKYYLSFIGPSVKIALFAILIPLYGIWGIVLSLIAFHLVTCGANIFFFKRIEPSQPLS